MRKIYVSSSCINNKKISDSIYQLAKAGFQYIELSGGTQYYKEYETDLIDLKSQYSLKYACHAYFPPPLEDFVVNLAACNRQIYEKSIKHYLDCIDMMERVGIYDLSIHAGFLIEISPEQLGGIITSPIIYERELAIRNFCDAYKEIEQYALKKGINVYLENNVISQQNMKQFDGNNYLLMTDADTIYEIRNRIKFSLLLDLAHLYVSSCTLKCEYKEQIRLLKELVGWVHISENDGYIDEHKELNDFSDIVLGCKQFLDQNVTLETKCNIDLIKKSYNIVMVN